MSLERPHSRASSGSRGPPPTPPPTYLWEELRRSRNKGGYPWTILYKPPLPDSLDIEQLLKGQIPSESFVDDPLKEQTTYGTDKRTHIRNRIRDRERSRRARSEPTPSLPSSSTISLSVMDQAAAIDPSNQSDELDDFPLPDEDIPDFVMAYLQSDKGNLDEDIPDHILEYIQSRAAILERDQQRMKQPDDEIFYTKDELRIIDQARKRLEEQGELNVDLPPTDIGDDVDAFDRFFQRASAGGQDSAIALPDQTDQPKQQEPKQFEEPEQAETQKLKKAGKFNFRNLSMPNKPQLNIKLPKFGSDRKKGKEAKETEMEQGAQNAQPIKKVKQRRTQSSSPMRQKINQQLESWNNSLKKFKVSRTSRNQDGQIKSFVALLPGLSGKPTKPKEPENQYEEVGQPRTDAVAQKPADGNSPTTLTKQENSILKATAESAEEKARFSPASQDEAEETMEDIENLPESEEADMARDGMIVDREVADVIITRGEFVDIDIDEDFQNDDEEMGGQTEQAVVVDDKTNVEPAGFAARSKKAFELTKSKIQTSLSKEQLQATRDKLQSTLSKQNLQATRKKMKSTLSKQNLQATRDKLQSTLSKENLQATRNKLQTSLNSTLNRKKNKKTKPPAVTVSQENIFPEIPQGENREYETSTPVERKTKNQIDTKETTEEELPPLNDPPTAKQRTKKPERPVENVVEESNQVNDCDNIQEETEEELEEELEPKLEFSLHGDRPRPSSVSQSTETLPEESDKENVVVRPKRQRYRHRRHGFHEEFGRPQSAHLESNIRSSWVEKTPTYPTISQEMLSNFCAPVNSLEAVNSNWGSMRKPDRPVRSRSKKELNSSTPDHHVYSNLPPRRTKRGLRKLSNDQQNDGNVKTWPRRGLATERPVAPRRCKSKKPLFPVCSNYQTWPRRSMLQSPPTAPKRSRSKAKVNCISHVDLQDLERQIEKPKITSNILIDADTLFGNESRFIDEEEMEEVHVVENQQVATKNENEIIKYNIPTESPCADEEKILNNKSSPKPVVPNRHKNNQTSSLVRKPKRTAPIYGESTWPRTSRIQPSAPQRRKLSVKKKVTVDQAGSSHLDLDEPPKKLPLVPASTPSEGHEISIQADGEVSVSSVQAGLDQILEILASTFPQESTNPPPEDKENKEEPVAAAAEEEVQIPTDTQEDVEVVDENPYAEIKQFQKRNPPPRPPPPVYAPLSASSYSYIYTVPRRKKGVSNSVSPERPPRTYCTIRPHRPPRRSRSRTQEVAFQSTEKLETNLPRRHSFSAGDDSNKEERDLQAAPIVERMRARPLPAPPRHKRHRSRSPPSKPPRSRTSSLKRPTQPEEVVVANEVIPAEQEKAQVINITDEYEPIENPVQVEEISVGIQTDPLPEYEESINNGESNEIVLDEIESMEINNNLYDPQETLQQVQPDIICVEPTHERVQGTFVHQPQQVQPEVIPVCVEPTPERVQETLFHQPQQIQPEVASVCVAPTPERVQEILVHQLQQVQPEVIPVSPVSVEPTQEVTLIQQEHQYQPAIVPVPASLEPARIEEEETRPQMRWSALNSPDPEPLSEPAVVVTKSDNQKDHGRKVEESKSATEEEDSFSQIPASFHRLSSIAPLPPIHLDFPTRLQLSDLDVERLNVREVTADRLIVSSVDTNSLQVCQMTTSNASGQLVFSIGPGVTIPFLTNHRERDETVPDERVQPITDPVSNEARRTSETVAREEAKPSTSTSPPPADQSETATLEGTQLRQEAPSTESPVIPVSSVQAVEQVHSINATVTADRPVRQNQDATVSELAMQLATLSSRHVISGVHAAATETYTMAQRVAELGLQQLNEQLQRRGITFDDKEKEDLKAVLIMLLIVVCAIFLLGMGKQRISNHWDFYFPN